LEIVHPILQPDPSGKSALGRHLKGQVFWRPFSRMMKKIALNPIWELAAKTSGYVKG